MRVALTHTEGRFEGLPDALRRVGFTPVGAPLLATRPRTAPEVRARAEALLALPWLLITSRAVVDAWRALDLPWRGTDGPRLGAVGPATARALERSGARVSLVSEAATAEGLAEAFVRDPQATGPVGLPQGARARPTLARALQRAGFAVRPLVVYDTVPLAWPASEVGAPDAVVLTSPSAVAALPQAIARAARLIAVGPTTAAAIEGRGWHAVTSASPEVHDLVDAVRRALPGDPTSPSERTHA